MWDGKNHLSSRRSLFKWTVDWVGCQRERRTYAILFPGVQGHDASVHLRLKPSAPPPLQIKMWKMRINFRLSFQVARILYQEYIEGHRVGHNSSRRELSVVWEEQVSPDWKSNACARWRNHREFNSVFMCAWVKERAREKENMIVWRTLYLTQRVTTCVCIYICTCTHQCYSDSKIKLCCVTGKPPGGGPERYCNHTQRVTACAWVCFDEGECEWMRACVIVPVCVAECS